MHLCCHKPSGEVSVGCSVKDNSRRGQKSSWSSLHRVINLAYRFGCSIFPDDWRLLLQKKKKKKHRRERIGRRRFFYLVWGYCWKDCSSSLSIPFGTSFPIPLFWLLTFLLGRGSCLLLSRPSRLDSLLTLVQSEDPWLRTPGGP